MRILLLNQAFYPDRVATAQHVLDLAKFLIAAGDEVTVYADRRGYEDRGTVFAKEEIYQGIRIHRMGTTGFGKKSLLHRLIDFSSFLVTLAFRLLTTPKPDIVISFTSPPLIGVLGALYSWWRGCTSIQWLMDLNPDTAIAMGILPCESMRSQMLNGLFEWSVQKSQGIVVLDRWMKARVEGHGVATEKITVVPPWTVVSPQPVRLGPNPFRQQHQLEGKFVVLYSGNFSIVHPLSTVLEAANRLRDDETIRFLFIGGGVRLKEIESNIKEKQLHNTKQLPWQPREMLPYSLGAGDLHIVVMGNEVSGLVHTSKIYAILALGKPFLFIGPKRSHVGDLLKECPTGFQVEHGDIDGMLNGIQTVRQWDEQTLAENGIRSRDFVRAHYTAEARLPGFYSRMVLQSAVQNEARKAASGR